MARLGIIQQGAYVVGVAIGLLTKLQVIPTDLLIAIPGQHKSVLALDQFFADNVDDRLVFSGILDLDMAVQGTEQTLIEQKYMLQDALWNYVLRVNGFQPVTRYQFSKWIKAGLEAPVPLTSLQRAA